MGFNSQYHVFIHYTLYCLLTFTTFSLVSRGQDETRTFAESLQCTSGSGISAEHVTAVLSQKKNKQNVFVLVILSLFFFMYFILLSLYFASIMPSMFPLVDCDQVGLPYRFICSF